MKKFTDFHKGRNNISSEEAAYLKHAYNIGYKSKSILVPVEKHINLDIRVRLSENHDFLFIDSVHFIASIGDFTMAYNSLSKAVKGLEHLEDQHISSLFGARI